MRAGIEFDGDYDNVGADVRIYEQLYQFRPRIDDGLPDRRAGYFATLAQVANTADRSTTVRFSPTCSPGSGARERYPIPRARRKESYGFRWAQRSTPKSRSIAAATPWPTAGSAHLTRSSSLRSSVSRPSEAVPFQVVPDEAGSRTRFEGAARWSRRLRNARRCNRVFLWFALPQRLVDPEQPRPLPSRLWHIRPKHLCSRSDRDGRRQALEPGESSRSTCPRRNCRRRCCNREASRRMSVVSEYRAFLDALLVRCDDGTKKS